MADIKKFIVKQAPAVEKKLPINGRDILDDFASQRRATRDATATIPIKDAGTFDYGIIVDKQEQYSVKDESFTDFLFKNSTVAFKVILKYNNLIQGGIPEDLDLSTLKKGDPRFSSYRWFVPQNDSALDECRHLDIGNKLLVTLLKDLSDTANAKLECFYINPADNVNNIVETDATNQQIVDSPTLFSRLESAVSNFWKPSTDSTPEIPIPFKNPAAPSFTGDNFIVNGQKVSSGGLKVKNFLDNSDVDTTNTASRKRKFADVRQLVIHETDGGGSANGTSNFLFSRTPDKLSVHMVCDKDGIIWQYFDLATDVTYHASKNNAFSVGIEVINPFHKSHKSKGWENLAKGAPWTGPNSGYYLPNLAQCESINLLIQFLANDSGLAIPANFLNFQGDIFRWDFLGEFTKNSTGKKFPAFGNHQAAGILSHFGQLANNHTDGGFLVLYSWLRTEKKLSQQEAYDKAKTITEELAQLAGKEAQADISKYLKPNTGTAIVSANKPPDSNAPIPKEGSLPENPQQKSGSEPRNFPYFQFIKVEVDFAKKIKSNLQLGSKYVFIREDLHTPLLEIKKILNDFGTSLTLNGVEFNTETKNISYLQRVGMQINLNKYAGLNIDGNIDTDEYLISQDKETFSNDFYKFNVWARVYSTLDEHESGISVYDGELEVIDITKTYQKNAKPELKMTRGRFINLTEIFKKYGFYGVYGNPSFYLKSDTSKSNWWIFENHNGLIKNKTTYGDLLSKTYKNNGEQIWLEAKKIWNGEKFIG